jgi:hypothetical protein
MYSNHLPQIVLASSMEYALFDEKLNCPAEKPAFKSKHSTLANVLRQSLADL